MKDGSDSFNVQANDQVFSQNGLNKNDNYTAFVYEGLVTNKSGDPLMITNYPLTSTVASWILRWDILKNTDDIQVTNQIGQRYVRYGVQNSSNTIYTEKYFNVIPNQLSQDQMNVSFSREYSGDSSDLIVSFENPCGAMQSSYSMKLKFTINTSSRTQYYAIKPFKYVAPSGLPCEVDMNGTSKTNAQCVGDDKELLIRNVFEDDQTKKNNTLRLKNVIVPKHVDSISIEIFDEETSVTEPIIVGTQYGMDIDMPILTKESLTNTIDAQNEINIDFNLTSELAMNIYGDIDIELGSSLPQSGTVYYTVENLKDGKKFSYYRYIYNGNFQLRYLRFAMNLMTGIKVSMRIPVDNATQYIGSHEYYLGFSEDRHPIFSG